MFVPADKATNNEVVNPLYNLRQKERFSFPIVNFPLLNGDGIGNHNSFAISIPVSVLMFLILNERDLCITGKLLRQGLHYANYLKP